MHTDTVQRWRGQRCAYRVPREAIDTRRYEVASIPDDTTAKRFVVDHHYSASFPAARRRFGLYRKGTLVGVAVFGIPAHPGVISTALPGDPLDSLELSRFVLLDDVPANGETWFLGRCFAALRGDFVGVVAFADPMPRQTTEGRCVLAGHVGTIYQAHNGVYLGRGRKKTLLLLPDGTSVHQRSISKLRARDRGWRHVARRMGHTEAAPDDAAIERALAALRPFRHPGNHKYAWALDRGARRHLRPAEPYPKFERSQLEIPWTRARKA